uniref:uncharacterized protein si:dkey-171c9.3 n=1 Tax=Scatophagus argus TaxID=75038 RepID=UPI001ED82C99|nr:uncharacterized protein si:dkey-171c9.3 [Scatophagus argus]XP_046237550.1 uncharacterized protein si:dkey-171c9.3 [Scatophagus argus]
MQTVSAEPGMPESTPENISEGLGSSHLNNGVLEKFAQNMAENIIQLFTSQMETAEPAADFEVSRFNQKLEMLADGLASVVIEAALKEACSGQNNEDLSAGGFQSSRSAVIKMDGGQVNQPFIDRCESQRDSLEMDTELDPGKEIQTSKDTQLYHPPLSQTGLPLVGSLDYPDAPPTTPLLPELERSRHSFARKLKGGLAKVFLPSPPPPTPKDKEDDSDGSSVDPRLALMEHLMHSLPTEDLARDHFEVGRNHGANMEAFADALSRDIIDWVLSASEQTANDGGVHLLAQKLAETIITSSLDEVSTLA